MNLYKSHLQVKKILGRNTIKLYLSSIMMFVSFCEKFHKNLSIPDKWMIKNLGTREIEAFIKHQIDVLNWKRSTMVTCISGIKNFYQFLAEYNNEKNPIQHFKILRDIALELSAFVVFKFFIFHVFFCFFCQVFF